MHGCFIGPHTVNINRLKLSKINSKDKRDFLNGNHGTFSSSFTAQDAPDAGLSYEEGTIPDFFPLIAE